MPGWLPPSLSNVTHSLYLWDLCAAAGGGGLASLTAYRLQSYFSTEKENSHHGNYRLNFARAGSVEFDYLASEGFQEMNTYRVVFIYKPKEQAFRLDIKAPSATIATRRALASFKKQVGPISKANHLWLYISTNKLDTQTRMVF